MIVYSSLISPRLSYVCDFIGKELTGKPFQLTDKKEEFSGFQGPRINYSSEKITGNEFWLQPHALLFEQGIKQQAIDSFELNDQKAFFKSGGDHPFDIFAACFYLLSRYEEYLPHKKDMYGRYAFENSLAYKENFFKPTIDKHLASEFEISNKREISPNHHSPPDSYRDIIHLPPHLRHRHSLVI